MIVTRDEWNAAHLAQKGVGLRVAKELQKISKIKRYPNNPYPCLDKWSDRKANDLTKAIIGFLRLIGYQAERVSSSGRVISNQKTVTNVVGQMRVVGSVQYIPPTSTNGTADVSATIEGMSVKIEVKIGRDKQSGDQKLYQKAVEDAGGIYWIAKDFQSFYDWVIKLIAHLKTQRDAIRFSS